MSNPTTTNIQALTEVLQLVNDGANLAAQAVGGFSFAEVSQLVKVVQDLQPVLADKASIIPQFLALDDDGRAALEAWVAANVSIPESSTVTEVLQAIIDFVVAASKVLQVLGVK